MSEGQQQRARNTATAVGHAVADFLARFGKGAAKETPQGNLMPQVRFGTPPKANEAKDTATPKVTTGKDETAKKPQTNPMPRVRFGFTPTLTGAINTTTAGNTTGNAEGSLSAQTGKAVKVKKPPQANLMPQVRFGFPLKQEKAKNGVTITDQARGELLAHLRQKSAQEPDKASNFVQEMDELKFWSDRTGSGTSSGSGGDNALQQR